MGWKSRHGAGIYQRTQKDRCGNDGNCRDGIVQGQQIPSTDGRGTWCISGKDGGLLKVEKKYSNGQDIGFVGEITEVNPKILHDLLEKDFLPIVCPVGMDDEFNTYNINADDAACAIARAVNAEKLAFLTDIEGVYLDPDDKSTLISELTVSKAKALIEAGNIGGGMLPKLNNCIDAIDNGVSRVHILDGRIAHCLLLEIFTNKGIGTAILGDKETKFYHE